MVIVLVPLLFGLSFLSGMLGLGVAFVAIPILGLFDYDLKDVIQPWALLLNGVTAISSAVAFCASRRTAPSAACQACDGRPVFLCTSPPSNHRLCNIG